MTEVLLGNLYPLMADGSPANVGKSITVVTMRDEWDDENVAELALSTNNDPMLNMIARLLDKSNREYAIGVLEVQQLWFQAHSPGDPPEWVESDDAGFANALSQFFGESTPVGRPDGWNDSLSPEVLAGLDGMTPPGEPPAGGVSLPNPPIGGGAQLLEHVDDVFSEEFRQAWRTHYLLTNGGRDAMHNQHLNGTQPAPFNFMAFSANATAESAANTTLPGEITTAGGGLLRGSATHAHTGGTNTSTMTKTATANGSDTLPVVIAKIGLLNAASAGTLGYEKLINSTATLNVSGDNVAVTFTLTAG